MKWTISKAFAILLLSTPGPLMSAEQQSSYLNILTPIGILSYIPPYGDEGFSEYYLAPDVSLNTIEQELSKGRTNAIPEAPFFGFWSVVPKEISRSDKRTWFKTVAGISGSNTVSFQSWDFPDFYLCASGNVAAATSLFFTRVSEVSPNVVAGLTPAWDKPETCSFELLRAPIGVGTHLDTGQFFMRVSESRQADGAALYVVWEDADGPGGRAPTLALRRLSDDGPDGLPPISGDGGFRHTFSFYQPANSAPVEATCVQGVVRKRYWGETRPTTPFKEGEASVWVGRDCISDTSFPRTCKLRHRVSTDWNGGYVINGLTYQLRVIDGEITAVDPGQLTVTPQRGYSFMEQVSTIPRAQWHANTLRAPSECMTVDLYQDMIDGAFEIGGLEEETRYSECRHKESSVVGGSGGDGPYVHCIFGPPSGATQITRQIAIFKNDTGPMRIGNINILLEIYRKKGSGTATPSVSESRWLKGNISSIPIFVVFKVPENSDINEFDVQLNMSAIGNKNEVYSRVIKDVFHIYREKVDQP